VQLLEDAYNILTTHAMSGDEGKAKAAGCDAYLSKPIKEDLLYAKLRTLFDEG
jgi:CheY-like chemotaxis protein